LEGDPASGTWDGLDDVWLPRSLLEVTDGDSDGFAELVGVFVSRSFDSNSPTLQDPQNACRSLNGGMGK
jgi:hypothetical protein